MEVLGPGHKIKQHLQVQPRNWISKSANITPIEVNKTFMYMKNTIDGEDGLVTLIDLNTKRKSVNENNENSPKPHKINTEERKVAGQVADTQLNFKEETTFEQHENEGNSRKPQLEKIESKDRWESIQEVVETDFLTSPADIYRNRRVELEHAVTSEKKETLHKTM